MKKKNILMIALSLCLVAIIAVGGTLAYFTDTTDSKVNTFTTGMVDIEIVDETPNGPVDKDNPDGPQMVTGSKDNATGDITYSEVMPGDVISKTVGVTVNEESQEAWVAIKVDVTATPGPDSNLSIEDAQDAVWARIREQVKPDLWEEVEGEDEANSSSVFYFKTSVNPVKYNEQTETYEPEDVTKVLFDRLNIPGDTWGNDFASIRFTIDVQAFAVQAANVDTYDAAKAQIQTLIENTPELLG